MKSLFSLRLMPSFGALSFISKILDFCGLWVSRSSFMTIMPHIGVIKPSDSTWLLNPIEKHYSSLKFTLFVFAYYEGVLLSNPRVKVSCLVPPCPLCLHAPHMPCCDHHVVVKTLDTHPKAIPLTWLARIYIRPTS
jgi:hypothetical protein